MRKGDRKYTEFHQAWVNEYINGNTIISIMRRYKVNRGTIRRVLFANGVQLREIRPNTHESFLKCITINPENNCWEWTAGLNGKGYGQMRINGRTTLAHRYTYKHFVGNTKGFYVCHKCDNPKCCNPEHLFLGTYLDNLNDMWNKGRGGRKLLPADIPVIKELANVKKLNQREIGEKYGVARSTIASLLRGETWSIPSTLKIFKANKNLL